MTTVTVRRHPAPAFPFRCVACGAHAPSTTAVLYAVTQRTTIFGQRRSVADVYSVDIPCCSSCRWRLHLERITGSLSFWVIMLAGFALFFLLLSRAGSRSETDSRTTTFVAVATFLLTSFAATGSRTLWYRSVRPALLIDSESDLLTFTFRNDEIAHEFAMLNDAIKTSMSGGLTDA